MKKTNYHLPFPSISRCQRKGIVTIQAFYQAKSQDNSRFQDKPSSPRSSNHLVSENRTGGLFNIYQGKRDP